MATDIPGIANPPEIDTANEYGLSAGENLPNHSTAMRGRAKFVRQVLPNVPTFRTRQEAYRFSAWLVEMAEVHLPNEDGCELHTFEAVRDAIQNT